MVLARKPRSVISFTRGHQRLDDHQLPMFAALRGSAALPLYPVLNRSYLWQIEAQNCNRKLGRQNSYALELMWKVFVYQRMAGWGTGGGPEVGGRK